MIAKIIELLAADNHYNVSENVEIAKGKYEIITTLKGFKRKIKRGWQLKKQ